VTDRGRVSIVPINGNTAPRRPFDGALVLYVTLPENAVSWFQFPRFFAGHSCSQKSRLRVEEATALHSCFPRD
jgi:hypothetical protein